MPSPPTSDLQKLAELLERRLKVISDHAFRDRDPAGHLEALKTASEAIKECHSRLKGQLPPRLEHFLSQCSYQKAHDFILPLLPE
jgi:hypothetical protein